MSVDHVKWIARRTAECGLRLKDASALFDALYIADVLAVSGGNMKKAAERSGMQRESLQRIRRKNQTRRVHDQTHKLLVEGDWKGLRELHGAVTSDERAEYTMHKARANMQSLPQKIQRESQEWLRSFKLKR